MQAFLTGSQVYGTPSIGSDVDLVIEHDDELARLLLKYCDRVGDSGQWPDISVVFGKLNILILPSRKFAAWKEATDSLQAVAPVTRDLAVTTIERYEQLAEREANG